MNIINSYHKKSLDQFKLDAANPEKAIENDALIKSWFENPNNFVLSSNGIMMNMGAQMGAMASPMGIPGIGASGQGVGAAPSAYPELTPGETITIYQHGQPRTLQWVCGPGRLQTTQSASLKTSPLKTFQISLSSIL